jgi:hypothetical protein
LQLPGPSPRAGGCPYPLPGSPSRYSTAGERVSADRTMTGWPSAHCAICGDCSAGTGTGSWIIARPPRAVSIANPWAGDSFLPSPAWASGTPYPACSGDLTSHLVNICHAHRDLAGEQAAYADRTFVALHGRLIEIKRCWHDGLDIERFIAFVR